MEYKRVTYLLSLLHSATEGEKKEQIGELFKRAVISTDEYQKLKKKCKKGNNIPERNCDFQAD